MILGLKGVGALKRLYRVERLRGDRVSYRQTCVSLHRRAMSRCMHLADLPCNIRVQMGGYGHYLEGYDQQKKEKYKIYTLLKIATGTTASTYSMYTVRYI